MFREKREKKEFSARKNRPRLKKKTTKYLIASDVKIDYKNVQLLQKYITDRGKILSRRFTSISGEQQRHLAIAIKRAKFLGLLSVGNMRKRFV